MATIPDSRDPQTELPAIEHAAGAAGFHLAAAQPHISGERYLMSPDKLVLVGTRVSDARPVIIKASQRPAGREEIRREKRARDVLARVSFTNEALLAPAELHFEETDGYTLLVTEFIEEERPFVGRPLEEQFFLALKAFEAQESFHATTYEHLGEIGGVFELATAETYLREFRAFAAAARAAQGGGALEGALTDAEAFLTANVTTIDRHGSYLTHTDFAPQNMRVAGHSLYLLDHAAVRFGNKYEGWARFLNFMLIHSPDLEHLLSRYVAENRGAGDALSLRLMRVHKAGLLLGFYARSLPKTEGNLRILTHERIVLWGEILGHLVRDEAVPPERIARYRAMRNSLRSPEETERQKAFVVL